MARKQPTAEHNYVRKISDLQAVGGLPPNSLATADVAHDDWCDALRGLGFCNCDPQITVRDGLRPPLDQRDGS